MALNLGSLYITFDANTQALVSAQKRIEQFATQVRQAYAGIGKGTVDPTFANSLNRQEQAIVRFATRISQLQQQMATLKLTPQGAAEAEAVMTRLGQSFNNYSRSLTQGVVNANEFSRRQASMGIAMASAQKSISTLSKTASIAPEISGWSRFTTGIVGLGSAALLVTGHFGGLSTVMFGLAGVIRAFGAPLGLITGGILGLGAGLLTLGDHAIKVGIDMQSIQLSFNAISGSAAEAAHDINFVHGVAMQAGTSFVTLAQDYARFLAAAQESGQTLKTAQDEFKGLTLAGATLHLTNQQLSNAFLALQEMLSKGTVAMQQLRRQLGSEIPGAFGIAAQAMGVTEQKLTDLLKKGMIPAADFVPKFVAQLEKTWKIDPNGNINTFRASLGRLQTAWFDLGNTIGKQTNVLSSFAKTLDTIRSLIQFVQNNFTTLIGVVGAVTGAIVGLTTAWLIWQGLLKLTIVLQAVEGFIQLTAEIGFAASAMRGLSAVMVLFDSIPIVAVITAIAAAVIGATTGFNIFKTAVTATADQQTSALGPIEDYIKRQEAMGTQIKSVTDDLVNQTKAIQNNAAAMAAQANAQLLAAQSAGPSMMDYIGSISSTIGGAYRGGGSASPEQERQSRIQGLQQQVQQWTQVWKRAQADMQGLSDVNNLPDQISKMIPPEEKAAKGLDGIINKVKDLQDAAKGAAEAMQTVFAAADRGETAAAAQELGKQVEDMAKAREITNNLKPAQLAAAAATLHVADSIGVVNAALANLITTTRQAKEVTDEFLKVWADLDKDKIELSDLTTQFQTLLAFGDDPRQQKFIENLQKAQEQLRVLQDQANAGFPGAQEALTHLNSLLAAAGFQGRDAAHGLAEMLTQIDDLKEGIKVFDDMSKKFRDLEDEINNTVQELQGLEQGFGGKGIGSFFENFAFGSSLDTAFQEAIKRGQEVLDLRRQMADLPDIFSTQDINNASTAFLGLLQDLDAYKQKLVDAQEVAKRNADALNSFVTDGLNGIRDFLSGVKSLGAALADIGKSFLQNAWNAFVVGPAQDFIKKLGQSLAAKSTLGVDSGVASNTVNTLKDLANAAGLAGDATKQKYLQGILSAVTGQTTEKAAAVNAAVGLQVLSSAANDAAVALAQIAASAGGGGGGIGSLLSLLGLGGGSSSAFSMTLPTATPLASLGGPDLSSVFASLPGLALGGNMVAGQIYQINEPGVNGEYFIPRVNGYMSPDAPSGGSGVVMVDASVKYLDARGATPDAVALLKQEMEARDQRLHKQLPFLIDQRVMDSSKRGRY